MFQKRYTIPFFMAAAAFFWAVIMNDFAFEHTSSTITCLRFLYALCVYTAAFYIIRLIANRNDRSIQIAIRMFFVYELVNAIIFLMVYPGAWKWDDINVFNELMDTGRLNYWQGYLTIVFYILSLFLIPFPAGCVIVQFTLISVIFGYFAYVISKLHWNGKWKYLLLLPFFFIPALDFNMWPLRLSIYCFLEMLLAVLIIEPRLIDGKQIWELPKRCILIVILTAILSVWRSEGFAYVLLVPLTLFFLYRKPWRFKSFLILAAWCISLTFLIGTPQRYGVVNKDYDLTGVLLPLTPLCAKAVENGDEDIVKDISRVLNTQKIAESYHEGRDAIALFWENRGQLIRYGFTHKAYKKFQRAYIRLILKYPSIFISERIHCFSESWKIPGTGSICWLYTTDDPGVARFANSYHFNRPLNNTLRIKTGEILNAEGSKATLWTFNFYFQTAAVFILTVYLLYKKSDWLLLALMMEARVFLTFLTAPATFFMYYYNLWLFGSVILCGGAAIILSKLSPAFSKGES